MRIRWLGWAGVELEAAGARVVIDPLQDAGAVFAWRGGPPEPLALPRVVPAASGAVAGLVTHLHRDHADADALRAALAPAAVLYGPPDTGGGTVERLGIAQAEQELAAAGLTPRPVEPWSHVEAGPFRLTALPAVDGTGDPQVSWLVEAGGRRVLHLGDTMWHGWWWRIRERYGAPDVVLAPVNGARLTFPHRRPPSPLAAVLDPEQAVLAAELLQAGRLVPIHFGGYAQPGLYEPVEDALGALATAGASAAPLAIGEAIELAPAADTSPAR